jgi:hypothetical protein
MDNPKRGQRSATNKQKQSAHQKSLADGIRKASASTSTAGSAIGGGT